MGIHGVGIGRKFNPKSSTFQHLNNSDNTNAVRVTRVILNEDSYPDLFNNLGGWDSLGVIFFDNLNVPSPRFIPENFAYPLFPHIKNYPLVNEVVFIIELPSIDSYESSDRKKLYYFTPLNLWNNVHNNAIPDVILPKNKGEKIILGEYFEEKENIRNLKPYEGDVIFEGRWGNSIRFGSTTKNINNNNEWSKEGNNGDPITIIRNGQPLQLDGENWEPISESINDDLSSIYITSNQQIPIKVSSNNYGSYRNPPQSPSEYTKPQIILNSNRVLLNSREDILLSSTDSINLNSKNTINIDSEKETIISSPKIYLGDKDADEPLVLGNKATKLLENILDELISVSNQLSSLISLPPGVPFIPLNVAATKANVKLNTYKNQLKTILSRQNYTK
jgi:hypothetical protein